MKLAMTTGDSMTRMAGTVDVGINTHAFFTQLNYSAANEDGRSECLALNLKDTDQVVCITGSGARPLDLAIVGPKKIFAVDFNANQNHLLSLKIAAIHHLDYESFAELIGLEQSSGSHRIELFQSISKNLDQDCRMFWEKNLKLIDAGVLYAGSWERWLALIAKLGVLKKSTIRRLFAANDIEEQRAIWQQEWDGVVWRSILGAVSSRWLWKYVLREPGIAAVPEDFDIAKYLRTRFTQLSCEILFRDSAFAQLLFFGKFTHEPSLPAHLRRCNFGALKKKIKCIEVITAPLIDFLKGQRPASIDAFSVSDFCSYTGSAAYRAVWREMIHAAADGARICERQFLVKFDPMQELLESMPIGTTLRRNSILEDQLDHTDTSFIYSFVCGLISVERPTNSHIALA